MWIVRWVENHMLPGGGATATVDVALTLAFLQVMVSRSSAKT